MTKYTFWVGFDDDAKSIDVAVYREFEEAPYRETRFGRDDRGLGRLVKMLRELPGQVRCVYEAGPCGYALQRYLSSKEITCVVAAPSKTPRKPGDRVKTNRIDARKLAKLYRSNELTMVAVPDEAQEALRDLMRAREDVREDVLRWRHRVSKLLLRYGYRYEKTAWTLGHLRWIDTIRLGEQKTQAVLDEYKAGLRIALEQLARFDERVAIAAQEPANAPFVPSMSALRGNSTSGAVTHLPTSRGGCPPSPTRSGSVTGTVRSSAPPYTLCDPSQRRHSRRGCSCSPGAAPIMPACGGPRG